MHRIYLSLTLLSVFILTACAGQSNGPFIEADENWPEICRNQNSFAEGFPIGTVYPNSVPVDASEMEYEGKTVYLASFCTKDSPENIVAWYKNKYEPQGYEYYTIETVHYWKKENHQLMLDIAKDFGEHVFYTVDTRE